ncbi:MAG: hypothetical protein KF847_06280 [Pirellulales bacterium]|nr:hypothetical protein [Pirellulales bacterium]
MSRRLRSLTRSVAREAALCALAAMVVFALAEAAVACPTCKDGVAENDPDAQRLAAGFYYSILFMLTMPLAILGTFGTACYRAVRKARAEQVATRS